MKKTVKLGYIPTRRNVFSAEEAREFRKKIKETIRSWGAELVDIDDITAEGLLVNESELAEIVKKMKSEQVDGLFSLTVIWYGGFSGKSSKGFE